MPDNRRYDKSCVPTERDPWDYNPDECWMCGRPSAGFDSAGLPVCENWTNEAPADE